MTLEDNDIHIKERLLNNVCWDHEGHKPVTIELSDDRQELIINEYDRDKTLGTVSMERWKSGNFDNYFSVIDEDVLRNPRHHFIEFIDEALMAGVGTNHNDHFARYMTEIIERDTNE